MSQFQKITCKNSALECKSFRFMRIYWCWVNCSHDGNWIFRRGSIPYLLMPWRLLMPWLLKSPEHQQAWYWLCRTDNSYCCSRVNHTLRTTKLLGGILVSHRLSVRLSRLPCPLYNIYNSGWILSILATNDHYHKRVCRTQWPLTLTYIFKVIRPWLRKPCPLCSFYSSGWILFIFGTNDYYH